MGIYRNAVMHISRRYDESAWFRLAFLLAVAAICNGCALVILAMLGPSNIAAAIAVLMTLLFSWWAACIIVPSRAANEGIGGA